MAILLKHTTQAVGTDAGNGEIAKTQWNENHTLTQATNTVLGRATGGTGVTEEIGVGAGVTLSGGSLAVTENTRTATIGYVIDGGGAAITTGVAGAGLQVPYACTINSVTLLSDVSGSIVVDIWKDTYANYPPTVADSITASAKPTLSSATKYEDPTLTGWTTSIAAGDIFRFNVDSASTVQQVVIILKVTKT
jgi:hypothetical protein